MTQDKQAAENGALDWSRLHHGICPACGEDKFIGHGPLCLECFTTPPASPADEGQRGHASAVSEYNAAVANGLMLKARRIKRRILSIEHRFSPETAAN